MLNKLAISPRTILAFLLILIVLTACSQIDWDDFSLSSIAGASADACQVTEPEWVTPPEDSAVSGSPEPGFYWVNEDRSIWASAWWTEFEEYRRAGDEGVKVGWFRPAGAELVITGQRLDGESEPLHSHVPCCYPTRFQATGLYFPTEGCWEVTARAITKVGAIHRWGIHESPNKSPLLSFVVRIDP